MKVITKLKQKRDIISQFILLSFSDKKEKETFVINDESVQ